MNPVQPLTGRMARALQITWLFESSQFLLIGWLMHRSGYDAFTIAAWLGGWFFGFRALLVSDGFRGGEWKKSPRKPEHRIGFFGALRLWFAEYAALMLAFGILIPFERWLMPLAPAQAAPGRRTPVILVHGYACNRGYWIFFARALRRAKFGPVYAVTLEPVFGDIDEMARRLGEIIEQICAKTGAPQVALVGHSMGGLISRAYLHNGGASRIERIVTLGSPHHGTYSAHAVRRLAKNADQMSLRNGWLAQLNQHENNPCPVPITSILTTHDNIVYPQHSAVLKYPNARNLFFPGLGHVELVFSPKIVRKVIEEMRG